MKRAKWLMVSTAVLCIVCLLAACGKSNNSEQENQADRTGVQYSGKVQESVGGISTGEHRVIATVNGEDIYEDVFLEWFLATMSLNMSLDMSVEQDEQVVETFEEYKIGYLKVYAEQVAMLQEAQKSSIEVDDVMVENYRDMILSMYAGDEETFEVVQGMWGFTDGSMRYFLWQQMMMQSLYEDITKSITAPSQSAEEYYWENIADFNMEETRTVRHILVETMEEASEIITALDSGEDFASLVGRSLDVGSASVGGVIGPFYPSGAMVGGGALVTPFTEATYALGNVGDYTREPAESEFGFHIIILDDITPPSALSLDEVRDELQNQLLTLEKEEHFQAFYQKIVDAADFMYTEEYTEVYSGFDWLLDEDIDMWMEEELEEDE